MKFSASCLAAAAAVAMAFPTARGMQTWEVVSDAKLPFPVSDHSSTFVPGISGTITRAGIYIAGGCDSPDGNTHVDADGLELDFFLCEKISDDLHVFDPVTASFRTAAKLPRARYRHAAVSAKGKLWLVGGRTIPDDAIIPEVDVYDPSTDSWTTVGTIPRAYQTSDNGAFASLDGSTIYVVGGYNEQYFDPDALATTFSFETQGALDQLASNIAMGNQLVVQDLPVAKMADLQQGRGDIHAVSSQDGTKAYVAGGYAGMCQPLTSAEVYDLETDSWSPAGDLLKARGDGAMVEASGTIFAIGGEVNHPDQCAAPELVPPLAHQSLAVDDVEAFEYAASFGRSPEWVDVADIPEFRFRFSAAAWPSTGVAYAFGGQTSFDESCKCFPTTDEITAIDAGILLSSPPDADGGLFGKPKPTAEDPPPSASTQTLEDDGVFVPDNVGTEEGIVDSYDGEIIEMTIPPSGAAVQQNAAASFGGAVLLSVAAALLL